MHMQVQLGDPLVSQWWKEAAALYTEVLVDVSSLDLSDTSTNQFQSILDKAASARTDEMRIVGEITGRWMAYMVSSGNPPMTPHHTQILTMLLFARYYTWCGANASHRKQVHALRLTYLLTYSLTHLLTYSLTHLLTYLITYLLTGLLTYLLKQVHALVAQVATGEGKSMIIAMLAIYLSKVHGRKVAGLLDYLLTYLLTYLRPEGGRPS